MFLGQDVRGLAREWDSVQRDFTFRPAGVILLAVDEELDDPVRIWHNQIKSKATIMAATLADLSVSAPHTSKTSPGCISATSVILLDSSRLAIE